MKDHPTAAGLLVAGCLGLASVALLLRAPALRRPSRKFWYLTRNAFTADRGWRDLVYWVVITLLVAVPIAMTAGLSAGKAAHVLDRETFFFVLGVVMLGNAMRVAFQALTESKMILRPVHGVMWRRDRKVGTAGVLDRVSALLRAPAPVPLGDVHAMLTDVLSLIASHVRDHRGNHRSVDVFANLLLLTEDNHLVVVARDRNLHNRDRQRDVPKRYPSHALAVARAIDARQSITVGDYREEYPESPKNRPYASILGIPLLGSDGNVIGVVSIDSTRPFFFETFTPGTVVDDLENSLAPYTATVVMVLENLVSRSAREMVSLLVESVPPRRA